MIGGFAMMNGGLADTHQPPAKTNQVAVDSMRLNFSSPHELAVFLERRIDRYVKQVEQATTDPEVIQALLNGDQDRVLAIASELQQRFTDNPTIRLLPKNAEVLDYSATPACGFVCAELARQSYQKKPPVEALLYNTPDAQILLVRSIQQEQKTIGVLIAQYPYQLLKAISRGLQHTGLYTELRQRVNNKPIKMRFHGDPQIKQGDPVQAIPIKQTQWDVATWTPEGVSIEQHKQPKTPWLYIGIGGGLLALGLLFIVIRRWRLRPAKASGKKRRKP